MSEEASTTAVQTDTGDTGDTTENTNSTVLGQEGATASTDQDGVNSGDDKSTGDEAGGDDQASPETYSDFALPEGVELNEQLLEEATPLFKDAGLSKEQAQKFVDLHAKMVQEGARQQAEQFSKLVSDWHDQAINDKQFGGDDFQENVGIARLAVEKLGTPEFKQLMEDHGVGNHPEMIRFMWNVGKLMKEDVPGQPGGPSTPDKDRVSILYPNG